MSTSGLKSDLTVVFLNPISNEMREFWQYLLRICEWPYFYFRSPSCSSTQFIIQCENFGNLQTFEAVIGLLMFAWIFRTPWPKIGFLGQNRGRGGVILTPNKLVLTFGGYYLCAKFGENQSKDLTVRVGTGGHTHTDANWFYHLSHAIAQLRG